MRQVAASGRFTPAELSTMAVDVIDWERGGAEDIMKRTRKELGRDVFADRYRPRFVIADATTAVLRRPDLITSIEGIQYIPDKLRALASWYNQLADGGLLLVAAETRWPSWIRHESGSIVYSPPSILTTAARALQARGVRILAQGSRSFDDEDLLHDANYVLLEKLAGTRLVLRDTLRRTWTNPYGYEASYYGPRVSGASLLKVTRP